MTRWAWVTFASPQTPMDCPCRHRRVERGGLGIALVSRQSDRAALFGQLFGAVAGNGRGDGFPWLIAMATLPEFLYDRVDYPIGLASQGRSATRSILDSDCRATA